MIERVGQLHPIGGIVFEHLRNQIKQLPMVVAVRRQNVPVKWFAVFAHITARRRPLVPVDQFAMVVVLSPETNPIRVHSTPHSSLTLIYDSFDRASDRESVPSSPSVPDYRGSERGSCPGRVRTECSPHSRRRTDDSSPVPVSLRAPGSGGWTRSCCGVRRRRWPSRSRSAVLRCRGCGGSPFSVRQEETFKTDRHRAQNPPFW